MAALLVMDHYLSSKKYELTVGHALGIPSPRALPVKAALELGVAGSEAGRSAPGELRSQWDTGVPERIRTSDLWIRTP